MSESVLDALEKQGFWCCEIPHLHHFMFSSAYPKTFTYFVGTTLEVGIMSKHVREVTWNYALQGWVYLFQPRYKFEKNVFEYMVMKAGVPPVKRLIPYDSRVEERRVKSVKGSSKAEPRVEQLVSRRLEPQLLTSYPRAFDIGELGKGGLQGPQNLTLTGAVAAD